MYALNEAESKDLVKKYGVPVVEGIVAASASEAAAAAETLGFPVVLKGLGSRLAHKTERGLVWLNLNDSASVSQAAYVIAEAAGDDLEGYYVQRMMKGKREFVAGLFRDRLFGPVIMFGIGGIFTEAFGDVVFRIAPVNDAQIFQMIDEIRAKPLLDAFRGEPPVDKSQIARVLKGLSELALKRPDVMEIDINPILACSDGRITAVDALAVMGQEELKTLKERPHIDTKALRYIFYPRSIAFVGLSTTVGKWGYTIFSNVVAGNFKGAIYPVNPKGGNIAGMTIYETVADIPGDVDLVVVAIPAAGVLELIPQFKAKGIKAILLVSSGFGETGEEGRLLEQKLVQSAREAGILILGPNTMGICNPHADLFCTYQHVRPKPGTTTFISQSGNLGTQFLAFAEREGIGIRAFVGSGNEAMITIEDYMDAIESDDLTKNVALYMESVKDGRRFFESAKRVSHKKPIVMLKGGRTPEGDRAATSHTGAMASNVKVFEAACRQGGIILCDTPIEMLDMSAVFSSLPLPAGNRVAIITLGGGWGVVTTDLCIKYGLQVPKLSSDLISKIDKILPPYWSRSNPIDLVAEMDLKIPMILSEELLKWDECDALIHLGVLGRKIFVQGMIESVTSFDSNYDRQLLDQMPQILSEFDSSYTKHVAWLMEKYKKPVLGVGLIDEQNRIITDIEGSPYKGISFPSPERAVRALAKLYSYRRWLDIEGV